MHLFDLSGMSGLEWQITHQTHHNQPYSSIDHQMKTYTFIGVRIHKYIKHRSHHRYQSVYFWLLVSLYLPAKLVVTTAWMIKYRKFSRHKYDIMVHLLAKALLLMQVTYCVHLHGFWMAITCFSLYMIATSQTTFTDKLVCIFRAIPQFFIP